MTQVSVDTMFEMPASSRRHHGHSLRRQCDDPVVIPGLAADIGTAASGSRRDAVPSGERNQVSLSLYQTYIPKLESAGLAEYDAAGGTGLTAAIDTYLGAVTSTLRWGRLNGTISAVTASLFVGGALGAPILATVSPLVVLTAFVLAVLSMTAVQFADEQHRRNTRPPELKQR